MRTLYYPLLPLLAAGITLSSCFHKSPAKDSADDILQSMVCHTTKGDLLVTHESIFQATSKSSGPKGNFTSGYADYRFTVRNGQTGAIVTRLVLGDRDADVMPLGYDGTQLWCYGTAKNAGLHARDPQTMQVTITQQQVEAANPALAGSINTPKLTDAEQYFSYDPLTKQLLVTDMQGNLFLLDPATLKASAIKKKPAYNNIFPRATNTSAYTHSGKQVALSGDPRARFSFGTNDAGQESYLSGTLLLEQNTFHLAAIAAALVANDNNGLAQLRHEHDSLLALYPVLSDERTAYLNIKDYHLIEHYMHLSKKISEWTESDSSYAYDNIISHLAKIVLGQDSNTVYVLHAGNLTDTSNILISRVHIAGNTAVTQWTTAVPQVYFDPAKAIKKGGLGDVFKAGNPQFDYERYEVEGNVLTGIKMLFAFGIDTNTGKLLWKVQL